MVELYAVHQVVDGVDCVVYVGDYDDCVAYCRAYGLSVDVIVPYVDSDYLEV